MDLRDQLQAALGSTYTIERELGGGGMSRVFVAEETPLGRRVVVKVLPEEIAGSVSVARFRREIAVAARLQHPHIVPVLSAGELGVLPYYTMPFVEGDSLRARLSHGELSVADTVSVLRDVARALEYAHGKGVTHRDIKPDNVLLAGRSAVITDFGVAKAITDATAVGTLTSIGVALGTPAYMAPEQAAADPTTDHRADIYAFGVMAYEMLAGHAPFAGRSAQAMLAAHATEQPTSIATLRPATPPRLAELVMRCIEKRPGDRPQSAAEIVSALELVATPIDGSSPNVTRPDTRVAGPARSRRSIVLGGVVIVLIAGSAVAAWWARSGNAGVEIRSVAVVPFENTSGDTAFDYLEDGITDHVRDALNAMPALTVKARSSSRQLKGRDAREIGAKLGVGAVLQGTVSRSSSRLHVTAELVRASDDNAIWSSTGDRQPNEIAGIQDSITRAVADRLHVGAGMAHVDRTAASGARGTEDAEAYDLFLRGRYAYDRFDSPRAEALLRAALARDPHFARAEGLLAMTQANVPVLGVSSLDSSLALTRATARHALEIDSTVVEAHIAESYALGSDMRLTNALGPLEKALGFDSTNADLLSSYALALAQVGRVEEGLVQARRARARDPLYVNAVGIYAYMLEMAHRFDEAIVEGRAAVELDPASALALRGLGRFYAFAGKRDSAVAQLERAFKIDSTIFGGRTNLIFGYAVAGRWDDVARHRALLAGEPTGNSPNYYTMMVALVYGDYGDAMTALERGVANREPLFSNMSLPCDPILDPLKADPRFPALMARLGARVCPASGRWPIGPPPR